MRVRHFEIYRGTQVDNRHGAPEGFVHCWKWYSRAAPQKTRQRAQIEEERNPGTQPLAWLHSGDYVTEADNLIDGNPLPHIVEDSIRI